MNNQIVYYDNAETTLAHDHLTSSGAVYVGNVAGQSKRLNFVYRTDQSEGGTLGGELLIDNIHVYGFLVADADLDGDRDLADFAVMQRCFGSDPLPDECWAFDLDALNDVTLIDFNGFASYLAVSGPALPPIP